MIEKPEYAPDIREYPQYVLVTCDPNTHDSRTSSEMALVAMILENGRLTVSIKSLFIIIFFYL
jgi:hypothetical protein